MPRTLNVGSSCVSLVNMTALERNSVNAREKNELLASYYTENSEVINGRF